VAAAAGEAALTAGGAAGADAYPMRKVECPQCRQSEAVPSDKIYDTAQYQKFSAKAKRTFGFLNLKLTCKSCGKQFKYEDVPPSGD
jgi:hypothetical protein